MKSKIDMYVANKVREIRMAQNLSQEDLAFGLGKDDSFIGQVESHKSKSKYNVQHLNQIAIILKCSPQDFLPKKPISEEN